MDNKKAKIGSNTVHEIKIRQERYAVGLDNLKLNHEGRRYNLTNYSLFGLAFEATENIDLGATIDVELYFGDDFKIEEFTLEIKRKEQKESLFSYGAEVFGALFPVDEIFQIFNSHKIVGDVEQRYSRYKGIDFSVKNYIDDLYIWLNEMEEQVKKMSVSHYENANKKITAEKCVVDIVGRSIEKKLKSNNSILNSLVMHNDFESNKIIFEYYRYRLGKFIFQSPFTMRSFSKPRGYAGDFEMMNIIYKSDSFANSLFGSCMERAVELHEEPSAVRNRVKFLSEKIITTVREKNKVSILSVACGPAEEIKYVINNLDQEDLDRVELFLLDQDEDALKFAQQNIRKCLLESDKKLTIHLLKKNIKEIIVEGIAEEFDLIYSAGLFDYFSDAVATRAAKSLFKSLSPGGSLVIGNFNTSSPNTFGMLALFDWYLILRSHEDLKRIFNINGSQCSVESEPNNVNLFCVLKK